MYDIYTQLILQDQFIKKALYNQLVQNALIKYAQEGAGSKNVINNPNFWRMMSGMAFGIPGNIAYNMLAPSNAQEGSSSRTLADNPKFWRTMSGMAFGIPGNIMYNTFAPRNVPNTSKPTAPSTGTGQPGTPSKAFMAALLGPVGAYAYRSGWL